MALIIDAPIPKNCLSCPSKEHCLAFGKVHFNERLKMLDECRRADNCPIIGEIPDKHGRLIDADKLIHAFDYRTDLPSGYDIYTAIAEAETIVEATE